METHRVISGLIPDSLLPNDLPQPCMYLERRGNSGKLSCGHSIKKGEMYLRIPSGYYRQFGKVAYKTACRRCAVKAINNEISNAHFLLESIERDERGKSNDQTE